MKSKECIRPVHHLRRTRLRHAATPILVAALLVVLPVPAMAAALDQVHGGGHHTVVRKTDGTFWSFGLNGWSQLGDGTTVSKSFPVPVGSDSDWASFEVGDGHAVALKSDGTLWTWGYNWAGQLGDGTTTNRAAPQQVGTDTDWMVAAAGGYHVVAIKIDGSLWAWGYNYYGQLGDGTAIERHAPTRIGTSYDWSTVLAGYGFTIAQKNDGTIWSWGANTSGQLGNGSTTPDFVPTQIGTAADWTLLATGGNHTFAQKPNGTLWAWGANSHGKLGDGTTTNRLSPTQIGTDTDWTMLSAGFDHSLALKADGSLWAWGFNLYGRLGDGTEVEQRSPVQIGIDLDWATVGAGWFHSAAIRTNGALWTWGYNSNGQLGDGTTINRLSPTLISSAVADAGPDRVVAATSASGADVTLDGGGSYEAFEIGTASLTFDWSGAFGSAIGVAPTIAVPIGIDSISLTVSSSTGVSDPDTVQISVIDTPPALTVPEEITVDATGPSGTVVVYSATADDAVDGTLVPVCDRLSGSTFPVGSNKVICEATDSAANTATKFFVVTVFGPDPGDTWSDVAAGNHSSAALKIDGTAWAWGNNTYGELGDGTTTRRYLPVPSGSDNDWAIITKGLFYHTAALKTGGTLWTWGSNSSGQLGDGTTTHRHVPTQIGTNSDWIEVIAGQQHTVALRSDGALWAWGSNVWGQLGDGTSTDRLAPVRIGTDTDWRMLAAGFIHTLAVKDDGSLWAWGGNPVGQFGNGTNDDSTTPKRIGTDDDWSAVAAGGDYSLALKTNGTLWAWGGNESGQLGDESTTDRLSPVQIGTDTDWMLVAAGSAHSLALKADGSLWAWGENYGGQVGDGSTTNRHSPVRIGTRFSWVRIAGGGDHSVGLTSDRVLFSWGANTFGQLGNGSTIDGSFPARAGSTTADAGPDQIVEATSSAGASVDLNGGDSSTYGPNGDTLTYTWTGPFGSAGGVNPAVTLPVGTHIVTLTLTDLYGGSWADSVEISVADTTPPVISVPIKVEVDSAAPVVVNYTATAEDLVDGAIVPVCVPPSGSIFALGTTVVQCAATDSSDNASIETFNVIVGQSTFVDSGYYHTLAVRFDRTLWAWGYNLEGQLGDGTTTERLSPVQIGAGSDWAAAAPAAGRYHSLALRTDGSLWAWGRNLDGQLGDGSYTSRLTAVQIGSDTDWSFVDAGYRHSVALKNDGTLWTWGYNAFGQLGDGTTTKANSPAQVGTDTDWTGVAAGGEHTFALKSNGTVWAWGRNNEGQLGDTTTTNRSSPVQVETDTDWAAIAAGDYHTVACKTGGSLWTWGDNLYGQLGVSSSSISQREYPAQVGSATDWAAPSGGYSQSLALKVSNALWTLNMVTGPEQIGIDTDWTFISAGSFHSAAIKSDGSLWTWGFNNHGQLGTGTTVQEPGPVEIWSTDADGDGIPNDNDSCPLDPLNDIDNDGLCAEVDNCSFVSNPAQEDGDSDGTGDACDTCPLDASNDADSDGHCAGADNCPFVANADQADLDSDGAGDTCDPDIDGDGVDNGSDNCPLVADANQDDYDSDGVGDLCDSCFFVVNPDQIDTDSDSVGDACDNCPFAPNPGQQDADSDGFGDSCDPGNVDNDSDGYTPDDGDCDDLDPTLTPADLDSDGMSTCGGDCDDADAGLQDMFLSDFDSDGYTNGGTYSGCTPSPGYVRPGDVEPGDCDDFDASLTPADLDSDGMSTCAGDCDDADAEMQDTWYADFDSDGYTNGGTYPGCTPGPGYVKPYLVLPGDCDDFDPTLTPADLDSDGMSTCAGDCDDADAGMQDTWYADQDSDGYTDGGTYPSCSPPSGFVRPYEAQPGDCDDFNGSTYPGAAEQNDGWDNQCPGDDGYGFTDEISGNAGFHAPDRQTYSWPTQGGATSYEVARAGVPDFSTGCSIAVVTSPSWEDTETPDPGLLFNYLVRSTSPYLGSWGWGSDNFERFTVCP